MSAGWSDGVILFQMAKIDPMLTLASMFEEPSRGSKQTTYFPGG